MENKKIFIIEDEANLLYNLESHFSIDQFIVESSQGDEELEELIDRIKGFMPDYVILDLILPKIDGFEIIKRMKDEQELMYIPIFVFTDLSDEDSKARSLQMGAEYYFIKEEFDSYQFAEKVKKIINNQEKLDDDDNNVVQI